MRVRRSAAPMSRTGATLVELMVALLLLTVGVLAAAGSGRAVARELDAARTLDVATWRAASRLDSLRALDCARLALAAPDSDTTGDALVPDTRIAWSVARADDGDFLLAATTLAPDGRILLDLRARRRRCPA